MDDTVRLFFPGDESPKLSSSSSMMMMAANAKRPAPKQQQQQRSAQPTTPSVIQQPSIKPRSTHAAAAPPKQVEEHECFANTLSEFFLDFERHGAEEEKKLVDHLLTKHETYLQVLASTSGEEKSVLYEQERDLWILLNLLRQPAESPSPALVALLAKRPFDLTDAERLELEFKASPKLQLLHRLVRWTHLRPKRASNSGAAAAAALLETTSEDGHEAELLQVWQAMQSGALYFVPRTEVETTLAATPSTLPKWRKESLHGGKPYAVDKQTNTRSGDCYRARWKLSCRDLARCDEAPKVERLVYSVLGGNFPVLDVCEDVNVELWARLRVQVEAWSDAVLERHHGECGELIRGRTRGEATPVEDAILVQENAPRLQTVDQVYAQVLEGCDSSPAPAARWFLQLQRTILNGNLEEFCNATALELNQLRILVHVVLYFYLNAQAKQLLPRVHVSPLVRETLIQQYIARCDRLSPTQILPYLFCIKTCADLRIRVYEQCFTALTRDTDQARRDFLLALLPIANTFLEAELVVELLTEATVLVADALGRAEDSLQRFRWLVLLLELQPEAQVIQQALLFCANHLMGKHLHDKELKQGWAVIDMVPATASAASLEFAVWLQIYSAWRAAQELESALTRVTESYEQVTAQLSRSRDLERKRLFQLREDQVAMEERELGQCMANATLALEAVLLQNVTSKLFSQANAADVSPLQCRNESTGELLAHVFDLVARAGAQIELLWRSVQSSGNRKAVYGECVLRLTRALAHEVSRRMEAPKDELLPVLKRQVRAALSVVEHSTKILLRETEQPLQQYL